MAGWVWWSESETERAKVFACLSVCAPEPTELTGRTARWLYSREPSSIRQGYKGGNGAEQTVCLFSNYIQYDVYFVPHKHTFSVRMYSRCLWCSSPAAGVSGLPAPSWCQRWQGSSTGQLPYSLPRSPCWSLLEPNSLKKSSHTWVTLMKRWERGV